MDGCLSKADDCWAKELLLSHVLKLVNLVFKCNVEFALLREILLLKVASTSICTVVNNKYLNIVKFSVNTFLHYYLLYVNIVFTTVPSNSFSPLLKSPQNTQIDVTLLMPCKNTSFPSNQTDVTVHFFGWGGWGLLSFGLLQPRYSSRESKGPTCRSLCARRAPHSMFQTRASLKSLCDKFASWDDSRMKLFRIVRSNKWKKQVPPPHFQVQWLME
jgi:hypothetical protein